MMPLVLRAGRPEAHVERALHHPSPFEAPGRLTSAGPRDAGHPSSCESSLRDVLTLIVLVLDSADGNSGPSCARPQPDVHHLRRRVHSHPRAHGAGCPASCVLFTSPHLPLRILIYAVAPVAPFVLPLRGFRAVLESASNGQPSRIQI